MDGSNPFAVSPAINRLESKIAYYSRMNRTATSDARLTELFLDMLAAEQGAGDNTLSAYRSDLEDLSAFLARARQSFATAPTQTLQALYR